MTHNPAEQLRSLPPYLLDLLEPGEREQLERHLETTPSLREALERLRTQAESLHADADHVREASLQQLVNGELAGTEARAHLEHLLQCRDCRFGLSVLLAEVAETAERATGEPAAGFHDGAGPSGRGPWLRLAAAAAIAILGGAVGFGLAGREAPESTGPRVGFPIDLSVARSEDAAPVVATLTQDGWTLLVETIFPPEIGSWTIRRHTGEPVAEGTLRFRAAPPTQRRFSLFFNRDDLGQGAYVFSLRSADGSLEREWFFDVNP